VDGLLGKAGELTTQALLVILLPRLLGPADYGTFALALAVVSLASSSFSIGGPTLMSRFVPAAAPSERNAVARALAVRVGVWRVFEVLAIAVVAAVLALALPDRFPAGPTALVTLAVALDVAATLAFQIALGMGRIAVWSYRFGVQNAVLVAAALSGYALAGIEGALAGIALASAVALLWGAAAVARPLLGASPGTVVPAGALRFGALHAVANGLLMLTHRGGIVAVAILSGSSIETGYAALALGLILAAIYVVAQVFTVQLPTLSERAGEPAGRAGAEVALGRLARRSVAVTVPIALFAVAALEGLVPLVFGARFRGAEPAMALALAALPIAPLTSLAAQAAALRLRPWPRIATTAAGAAAFVICVVIAVPRFGAAGAAAALLVSTVTIALASLAAFPGLLSRTLVATAMTGSLMVVAAGILSGAV
jgi:O-antigen/teichoic acid export membrane protein